MKSKFIFILLLSSFIFSGIRKNELNIAQFHVLLQTFLSCDEMRTNATAFEFVNNSPITYKDLNGKAPIQIMSSVDPSGVSYLHNLVQTLTDDKVHTTYNGQNFEFSLTLAENSNINRPAGTALIRELSQVPATRATWLDLNNTHQISGVNGSSNIRFFSTVQASSSDFTIVHENVNFRFHSMKVRSIVNFSTRPIQGQLYYWYDGQVFLANIEECSPPSIVLGHELIHSYYASQYNFQVESNNEPLGSFHDIVQEQHRFPIPGNNHNESITWEEIRTVGFTRESPQYNVLDGIDFSNPISENALRRENNLPLRISYKSL